MNLYAGTTITVNGAVTGKMNAAVSNSGTGLVHASNVRTADGKISFDTGIRGDMTVTAKGNGWIEAAAICAEDKDKDHDTELNNTDGNVEITGSLTGTRTVTATSASLTKTSKAYGILGIEIKLDGDLAGKTSVTTKADGAYDKDAGQKTSGEAYAYGLYTNYDILGKVLSGTIFITGSVTGSVQTSASSVSNSSKATGICGKTVSVGGSLTNNITVSSTSQTG